MEITAAQRRLVAVLRQHLATPMLELVQGTVTAIAADGTITVAEQGLVDDFTPQVPVIGTTPPPVGAGVWLLRFDDDDRIAIGASTPPAWQTLTPLQNGWAAFGAGWQTPQWRRVGDEIQLRGLITDGTAAVIHQFPAGRRPPGNVMWDTIMQDGSGAPEGSGRIEVLTDGKLQVSIQADNVDPYGPDGFVSLDVVRFSTS